MGSVEFSQTAQRPCDQDVVLSGKIPLITSNLPSLSMYSMIQHGSYTARTGLLMPFQWCTSFCATSTAWEHTVASGHFWPINAHHMQVKHYHTTHELYDQSRIFNGIPVVCSDLHQKYYVGKYITLSYYFHTIQAYILVSCSNTMTVSRFIEPKILWYSTSILLNTIEAQLPEIQAEGWKNCQRYSHTLPRCTCIAKMSTQLEPNQKSGPSDIIHLPYSGTPKMYSAH